MSWNINVVTKPRLRAVEDFCLEFAHIQPSFPLIFWGVSSPADEVSPSFVECLRLIFSAFLL